MTEVRKNPAQMNDLAIIRTFPIKFLQAWVSPNRSSLLTLFSGQKTSSGVPRRKYFNVSTTHFGSLSFTLPKKAVPCGAVPCQLTFVKWVSTAWLGAAQHGKTRIYTDETSGPCHAVPYWHAFLASVNVVLEFKTSQQWRDILSLLSKPQWLVWCVAWVKLKVKKEPVTVNIVGCFCWEVGAVPFSRQGEVRNQLSAHILLLTCILISLLGLDAATSNFSRKAWYNL